MQGNYTRHSFLYVVPPAEPDAGQTVAMILVNEETVNLRMAASASEAAKAPVQVLASLRAARQCPRRRARRRMTGER